MEGQTENDELYPIAVLIDELKVCECFARLASPPPVEGELMGPSLHSNFVARRCSPQTECHSASIYDRPGFGPRADSRRTYPIPGWYVFLHVPHHSSVIGMRLTRFVSRLC